MKLASEEHAEHELPLEHLVMLYGAFRGMSRISETLPCLSDFAAQCIDRRWQRWKNECMSYQPGRSAAERRPKLQAHWEPGKWPGKFSESMRTLCSSTAT